MDETCNMESVYREDYGNWMQFACDRERFQRRINEMSIHIAPVLGVAHREKIFSERFRLLASSSIQDDENAKPLGG